MGVVAWWFVPLASAVAWAILGIVQLRPGRARRPAPLALLTLSFAIAGVCASEAFYLDSPTSQDALLWLRLRFTFIVLAAPWFPLWARWRSKRPSRRDLVLVLPTPALLAIVWVVLVSSVMAVAWGYLPSYDPGAQLVVLGSSLGFILLAALPAWASQPPRPLPERFFLLSALGSFLGAAAYGVANALLALGLPPVTGIALLPPGVVGVLVSGPLGEDALQRLGQRMAEGPLQVLEAYLVGPSGQILASKLRDPGRGTSGSSIPMVLETISQVMGTAFPSAQGDLVRTLRHGDIRVLVERGQGAYLALVVRGKENEAIRDQMRYVLGRMGGSPTTPAGEARPGLRELLGPFFDEPELF